MTKASHALLFIALAATTAAPLATNNDWPQWRGPARTGIVPASDAPAAWPAELTKGWTIDVGEGYSSPVAANGRVFLHSRRDPNEVVSAVDLVSGKRIWEQSYASPFAKNPYAKQMAKGPYATPLVSDDRLFTLGTSAILSAWNVSTGALLWRKDFSSRVDTSKLFCGTAMSPILTTHGLIVHVGDDRGGAIMALDPASGKERWTRDVQGPGYASPIELDVRGTAQIVTMTTRSVIGVGASNGDLLWEFPFDDEWNENIVTPVAIDSGIVVSGVRQGTRALAVTRDGEKWTVTPRWHTPEVTMYMSSPVLAKDTLFGHSSKRRGQFVAVDPANGRIRWATEGRDGTSAAVVVAGEHLLYLTTDSTLVVARLDPQAFAEVRRYTIATSPVYAYPIVFKDRVLVRDATHLISWTIR